MRLEIPSELRFIHLATEFAREAARGAQFDDVTAGQISVATDEAVTNVVKHAYEGKPGHVIRLVAEVQEKEFILRIFHTGRPLKKEAIHLPDMNEYIRKRRVGGLGLYLMTKLMDSVDYLEGPEHCCEMRKNRE
jgi:serine/threonine-protein kinase RsbW